MKFDVRDARVTVHDRGALDFAIRARTAMCCLQGSRNNL